MNDSPSFSRRTAAALGIASLIAPRALTSATASHPLLRVAGRPDFAAAFSEATAIPLARSSAGWSASGIELSAQQNDGGISVALSAPKHKLLRLHLRWHLSTPNDLLFLGDEWERSYGALCWRGMEPERVLPWYFLASSDSTTIGCGVKTNPGAFCFWQVDPAGVSLWLDVRNGGRGVELGSRRLPVASIVSKGWNGIRAFEAAKHFCRHLSPAPRMPAAPVYGGNNWYYAYGKSSADEICADSERISSLAGNKANRPFMVIDDGWALNSVCGPWTHGNARFPDMAELASQMKKIGVRPGIWTRPLFTKESVPEAWLLRTPNSALEFAKRQEHTLDPSVPEVQAQIEQDMRRVVGWGFELVKHDFSTYDLFGRWGFSMGAAITDSDWSFSNRTQTNAEIVRALYELLRSASGNSMVLGCNTVGHLAAGLFEMQRIGDDTSGRDWNRTRKMGVNTLAFRAPQHGTFFAVDADCAAITKNVSWELSARWLDLLARSGTPLFVSFAPDANSAEARQALKRAFEVASRPAAVAEPLDWQKTSEPQEWVLNGKKAKFNWFGAEGVSPFAT